GNRPFGAERGTDAPHDGGCRGRRERPRVAAAEDGVPGVLDHPREYGVPPGKRPGATDLMDLPLFSTEEIPHGDPRAGLDGEYLPDREPRALLCCEPLPRASRQVPAALRQVPGHDRPSLDVESVDRPGTEELQAVLGLTEVLGRPRHHVAEAAAGIAHHVEHQPLVHGVDGRRLGWGRRLVTGAEATLLVLLPATAGARGVS